MKPDTDEARERLTAFARAVERRGVTMALVASYGGDEAMRPDLARSKLATDITALIERLSEPLKGVSREEVARIVYDSWTDAPGYQPWVPGGNSDKQYDARKVADRILALSPSSPEEGLSSSRAISNHDGALPIAHEAAADGGREELPPIKPRNWQEAFLRESVARAWHNGFAYAIAREAWDDCHDWAAVTGVMQGDLAVEFYREREARDAPIPASIEAGEGGGASPGEISAGDTVECVDGWDTFNNLTPGQSYAVVRVANRDMVFVRGNAGHVGGWSASRFKRTAAAPTPVRSEATIADASSGSGIPANPVSPSLPDGAGSS